MNGHLYILQTPIFRVRNKEKTHYCYSESEKNEILNSSKGKFEITRFKGLGEMNPGELWQTTLNPENRTLLRIKYSNNTKDKSKKDQDLIHTLMGNDVALRKDFIVSNAINVQNLDI